VEGNRRLTALKLLLDPSLASRLKKSVEQVSVEAKYRPESVPAIVFAYRNDILDYLGYRHITGIKPWSSLAKTRYLAKLLLTVQVTDSQYRAVAKMIGSRTDYVAKLLTGLAVYDFIVDYDFFDIDGLDENSIDFSVLTTALSYGNIIKFLGLESNQDRSLKGLNIKHLREFAEWLFKKDFSGKTRLGESRKLIELNRVAGNVKALEAFRGGESLVVAHLLTDAPEAIYRKMIGEAKSRIQSARDTIHRVNAFAQADIDNLMEIQQISRNLRVLINQKLSEDEDEDV